MVLTTAEEQTVLSLLSEIRDLLQPTSPGVPITSGFRPLYVESPADPAAGNPVVWIPPTLNQRIRVFHVDFVLATSAVPVNRLAYLTLNFPTLNQTISLYVNNQQPQNTNVTYNFDVGCPYSTFFQGSGGTGNGTVNSWLPDFPLYPVNFPFTITGQGIRDSGDQLKSMDVWYQVVS